VSEFCDAAQRVLRIGNGEGSLRVVVEMVHQFNERRRRRGEVIAYGEKKRAKKTGGRKSKVRGGGVVETGKTEGKVRSLVTKILDIKNFLIRVPRMGMKKTMKEVVRRLTAKFEGVKYFGVERIPRMTTECRIPKSPL